ncbi:MAG: hypothetical protein GY827_06235 [Cytophagales bacterium]|nr:hypothetical protein [Cytophagales bacterium]
MKESYIGKMTKVKFHSNNIEIIQYSPNGPLAMHVFVAIALLAVSIIMLSFGEVYGLITKSFKVLLTKHK